MLEIAEFYRSVEQAKLSMPVNEAWTEAIQLAERAQHFFPNMALHYSTSLIVIPHATHVALLCNLQDIL
jgi:hypothetical protein